MRIAIITPVYPPYSAGISRMAKEEVKILEEAGFEVTVFTPRYSTPSNSPYFRKAKTGGEKVVVKYIKPVLKYGNAAFIPQLLWKLRGFDAIHLHYPFLGGASVALLWKKLFGRKIPLIVTYHMDLRGKGIFKIIFYIFTRIVTPIILKSASKIIVTTLDYAQSSVFYETLRGEQLAAKLVEVPPSVDVHKFQPNKKDENLLKQFNINHDDKVALFVGALDKAHYFKGIPALLAAFELIYKR
jgi:glycosyltransferase involved in cell wall biosynthesis